MGPSNVSSVTNFFPSPNEGFTTTLASTISSGATTVPLNSTSGLTNGTIFVGIIEPGAANEQVFTGTVSTSGSDITGVVWTRGTNVSHVGGVTIVDYVTGTAVKMMTTGILKDHVQTGNHNSLHDVNGKAWISQTATTNAVNALDVQNSATGTPVQIYPTGSDTNINLKIGGKGTGYVDLVESLFIPCKFSVYRTTAFSSSGFTTMTMDTKLFDTGSNYNTSTGLFTAPVNGFYQFNGFATGSTPGGNGIGAGLTITSSIGGNRTETISEFIQGSTAGFGFAATAGGFYQLNANDTVGFACYTSNNNTATGTPNTGFRGYLVGVV